MAKTTNEVQRAFELIGETVSKAAADVICSATEYRAGLRVIIAALETDLASSGERDDDS